ncbi:MAG TPA: dienelactone hydrolase family protein [Terriglobia bacterium]|nr:dienelactone hydrolase family protein [Terriglobia bacterium]
MAEADIDIRSSDGTSDGVLLRPEGDGRWPGVIFLTDIGGIRPAQREMARRLAAEGYNVLMPNVYYRTSRVPIWDFKPSFGADERTTKRLAELAGPLTPEAVERDAADYVNFLGAQESVNAGPMGVVGYCATGSVAMRFAAARPDEIAAAASFHGARLVTDGPSSPHLLLPRINTNARLYFGHAIEDRGMPKEAIEKLNLALKAWGGEYESEIYEGAYHSWTVPDSPVYNHAQAERAFGKLTDLFAKALKRQVASG